MRVNRTCVGLGVASRNGRGEARKRFRVCKSHFPHPSDRDFRWVERRVRGERAGGLHTYEVVRVKSKTVAVAVADNAHDNDNDNQNGDVSPGVSSRQLDEQLSRR